MAYLAGEDLRAQGMIVLDSKKQVESQKTGLESVKENLKARIYLLEKELTRADELGQDQIRKLTEEAEKVTQADKLTAKAKEETIAAKLKGQDDLKLLIEKVNEQGKELKELRSGPSLPTQQTMRSKSKALQTEEVKVRH